METTKKEIRNRRILFLFAVIVIGFAYTVSGQVTVQHRYDNRPDIETIYPTEPMEFITIKPTIGKMIDTISVNIIMDRVSKDTLNYKISVTFNNKKLASKYDFVVKFEDGTFIKLDKGIVIEESGYAEYIINQTDLDSFYWMKVSNILFKSKNDEENIAATLYKTPDFFFHFLHICSR